MNKKPEVGVTYVTPSKRQREILMHNLEKRAEGRVSDYSKVEEANKKLAKEFAQELEEHSKDWLDFAKSKRFKAKHAEEHCSTLIKTINECDNAIVKLEKRKSNLPEILKSKCPQKINGIPFKEQPEQYQEWVKAKAYHSDIPRVREVHAKKNGSLQYDREGNPVMIKLGNLAWQIFSKESLLDRLHSEYYAIVKAGYKGKYLDELHKLFK